MQLTSLLFCCAHSSLPGRSPGRRGCTYQQQRNGKKGKHRTYPSMTYPLDSLLNNWKAKNCELTKKLYSLVIMHFSVVLCSRPYKPYYYRDGNAIQ